MMAPAGPRLNKTPQNDNLWKILGAVLWLLLWCWYEKIEYKSIS
jgi:hypothetical protein